MNIFIPMCSTPYEGEWPCEDHPQGYSTREKAEEIAKKLCGRDWSVLEVFVPKDEVLEKL